MRNRESGGEAADYFISGAIRHPGRVRRALKREFGAKAFTRDGSIKIQYLDKAIAHAKRKHNTSLEEAELLAKRLKGY